MATQSGELRRRVPRAVEVGRRHSTAISPRRTQAVLRPVPEGRRAQGRHAARVHVQHRREPLGSTQVVAARVRKRMRGQVEAALFQFHFWPVV